MGKSMRFCDVHFSSGKKQIPKNTCSQVFFVFSNFHVFLTAIWEPKPRKNSFQGTHVSNVGPQTFQRAHPDRKWGPKGSIPSFGGGPTGQSYGATLLRLLGSQD